MGPVSNILLAAPMTLIMAVLSWKLVEARALAAVTPLADRIVVLFRKPDRATG